MNIQGNPRLTRLIEGNGDCEGQGAIGGDAPAPSLNQPSPTMPTQP
jgi:hypothetical protein